MLERGESGKIRKYIRRTSGALSIVAATAGLGGLVDQGINVVQFRRYEPTSYADFIRESEYRLDRNFRDSFISSGGALVLSLSSAVNKIASKEPRPTPRRGKRRFLSTKA